MLLLQCWWIIKDKYQNKSYLKKCLRCSSKIFFLSFFCTKLYPKQWLISSCVHSDRYFQSQHFLRNWKSTRKITHFSKTLRNASNLITGSAMKLLLFGKWHLYGNISVVYFLTFRENTIFKKYRRDFLKCQWTFESSTKIKFDKW